MCLLSCCCILSTVLYIWWWCIPHTGRSNTLAIYRVSMINGTCPIIPKNACVLIMCVGILINNSCNTALTKNDAKLACSGVYPALNAGAYT